MHELHWSPAEKQIARQAFDKALVQEKNELIQEVKKRAAAIENIKDVWSLERWINERGKQIDEKYDYRYSVLPMVFGRLIREGRLTLADLAGLAQDKIEWVQRVLSL